MRLIKKNKKPNSPLKWLILWFPMTWIVLCLGRVGLHGPRGRPAPGHVTAEPPSSLGDALTSPAAGETPSGQAPGNSFAHFL